jgi:hypothetical protein
MPSDSSYSSIRHFNCYSDHAVRSTPTINTYKRHSLLQTVISAGRMVRISAKRQQLQENEYIIVYRVSQETQWLTGLWQQHLKWSSGYTPHSRKPYYAFTFISVKCLSVWIKWQQQFISPISETDLFYFPVSFFILRTKISLSNCIKYKTKLQSFKGGNL